LNRPSGVPALVAAAFFVSGAAGLVYQVAWQRILALHSGVGIYSVAMIVAAFMAGLGLGSRWGGGLSVRVAPRRALATFGLLELGIGAFGAGSCALYYDLLYDHAAGLYGSVWRAGLLHFAALILPTGLMGMTLPFLVRASVRHARGAERAVGWLYGLNVLGAAAGAMLTPWVLIRTFGVRGAVVAAALGNAASGLAALGVAAGWRRDDAGDAPAEPAAGTPDVEARHPFSLWVALYGLSGFCALSLEIVWFRLLDVAVRSTAFTFGTLLAFYLLGSGLGCLAGIPLAGRSRRPLQVFLILQCVLLAYSGLSALLLVGLPPDLPGYAWFAEYWKGSRVFKLGEEWDPAALLRLYVLLPSALFGPPTILMGLSFPVLQRAVHDDARTSGRKVGILQAANIAGCVLGSLGVGLLALPWLGTTGSLRLLLAVGLGFAALGIRAGAPRTFAALALALALVAAALPERESFWRRLHGAGDQDALIEEDATGVGVLAEREPERWLVMVNGRPHSDVPFGGIHSRLGAAPALIHRAPRDVAIIGLGSGDTAWAAACRPQTRSVSVFEILGPQPRLLRRLAERGAQPLLRSFLEDPRVRVTIADGRNALKAAPEGFDVIEADALVPHMAGAGNLYSVEFFGECARRLKPGGIMCTWAPTTRVYASFTRAFPHVLRHRSGTILVGSLTPLAVDPEAWLARVRSPEVRDYLGVRVADEVAAVLDEFAPVERRPRMLSTRLNLDLFPRDEFLVR
jgi:predicted membrane-bound spermidine synthase